MSFGSQELLVSDGDFTARVRIALSRLATSVVGEAKGTGELADARLEKRHQLGVEVLRDTGRFVTMFARAICGSGTFGDDGNLVAEIGAQSTDEEIEAALSAAWNDFAAITDAEAATS